MYPNGFRYRDWVVAAFNNDLPYDQFIVEQIAGDLLPSTDETERVKRLPALGYFALGPVYYADAGCADKAAADEFDDRIDTLTRGFLALTVSCARCHDHKFDPISTQDYYALAGIFASSQYREAPLAADDIVRQYDDRAKALKDFEKTFADAQAAEARKFGESLAPQCRNTSSEPGRCKIDARKTASCRCRRSPKNSACTNSFWTAGFNS